MSTAYAPAPVLAALQIASLRAGEVGRRLYQAIATDFPRSLERRPAQLLTEAEATAEDLDHLLRAAGFVDMVELRHRAGAETRRRLLSPDLQFTSRDDSPGDRSTLRRVLRQEQDNLAETLDRLQANGALELAARAVLGSRRRWVFGDMKSTGYASLLATDLTTALRDVMLIQPTTASVLVALMDGHAADSLTVFSFRSYSLLTLRVAREFHRVGARVIALTDSYSSPVCAFADHVLPVNTGSESSTHSPTTVVAVGHVLATLSGAGAKGAARRASRRKEMARALKCYPDARHDYSGDEDAS